MKTADIKNLPNKFDFKSNINPLVPLYHAERTEHGYRVTCDDVSAGEWNFSKEAFDRSLMNGDYIVLPKNADNTYDFEVIGYYVEWYKGFNRKHFDTAEDTIEFAKGMKDKEPEIYQIRRMIL